ncbi:MAG: GntR family transcriptional regulator [Clostridia bacterium]|nr:GntR family transcriptional regulator [Clostridia bacterium]
MVTTMSRESRIPLYCQIYDALRERIENGAYLPGNQIPTEAELSRNFAVSSITVKQAVKKLVSEGALYRIQGKGTFVCQPKVNRKLNRLISFNDEMLQKGMAPSTTVLEIDVVPARRMVAEALGIREGDEVTLIRRLRIADGGALAVQTSYVPLALAPTLAEKGDMLEGSLYRILAEDFELCPFRGKESYCAVSVSEPEAGILDVPEGSPAFAVKRLAYLPDNRPVEYVESILRGDKYVLDVELQAPDM